MEIRDYNKLQINYQLRRDGGNDVIEKSTMVNIRCDNVAEAIELYQEMKKRLNGDLKDDVKKDEKETEYEPFKTEESDNDTPKCSNCGSKMVLRHAKNGDSFYGCRAYPRCKFTLPA